MQRERHLKRLNKLGCPRQNFITVLVKFITSLVDVNNKVILATDINEHVVKGKLAKELKKIGLVDSHVKKFQ